MNSGRDFKAYLNLDLLYKEMGDAVKIAYEERDLQSLTDFSQISFDILSNIFDDPSLTIMHQAVTDNANSRFSYRNEGRS